MQPEVKTPDFSKMLGELKGKDLEKVIKRTVADCKSRGPAQVTKAVTAVYGIKSSEVTEAGKGAKRGAKTVGSISVSGVSVDNVQFTYMGRLLTPVHFSMTPKKRPEGGKKYTVKAAIYKGKKRVLGSGVFLAPSGSAGTTEIPFKRTSEKRYPIEALRTVSIPQMITNERVSEDIRTRLNDLLNTRLKHNVERIKSKK